MSTGEENTKQEQGAISSALDRLEGAYNNLEAKLSGLGNRVLGVSRPARPESTTVNEAKVDHVGESDVCLRINKAASNFEGLSNQVSGLTADLET
jgi:hypothetical protein